MTFEKIRQYTEFLSFVALILGVPFGLIDFHNHAVEEQNDLQKQRLEAAESAYQTIDERYTEFVKLCMDHPRLDCYSVPRSGNPKPILTEDEKIQQKMLFTHLTDVFEVAFVQYHKDESNPEIRRLYDSQWAGWDAYIRKFMQRQDYLDTWYEIRDEYDEGLVKYMDRIAPPPPKLAEVRQ